MVPPLSKASVDGKPKLLYQVRDVIRRKHSSLRTERSYTDWIRRFILYHQKRHPRGMAEVEISQFLTHLARDGLVAASTRTTCNSRFAAKQTRPGPLFASNQPKTYPNAMELTAAGCGFTVSDDKNTFSQSQA